MPKVSIIVPIYKVEKYLKQCVDSLLCQTLRDIEIILVDDGSPDNCGDMADKYGRTDSRVKVIHKANAGLGMARNTGLAEASGEYIGFVDSDDWVEPDAYEVLYKLAVQYDADIVKGYEIKDRINLKDVHIKFHTGEEIEEHMLQPIIGPKDSSEVMELFDVSVWSNLYRHELIKRYDIMFKSEREYYGEDLLFNLLAFHRAKKVLNSDICFYHYRRNSSSLTGIYRPTMNQSVLKLYKYVESHIKDNLLSEECIKRNKLRLCNLTFNMIFNVCKLSNPMSVRQKLNSINEIICIKEVQYAFQDFDIEALPAKWKLIFGSIKNKRPSILYFTCALRQRIAYFSRK